MKVLKSYTRKAERKHEQSSGGGGGGYSSRTSNGLQPPPANGSAAFGASASSGKRAHESAYHTSSVGGTAESAYNERSRSRGRDGHLVEQQQRHYEGGHQGGFSESSSYETREHYERKVQKSGAGSKGGLTRTKLNGLAIDGVSRVASPVFINSHYC